MFTNIYIYNLKIRIIKYNITYFEIFIKVESMPQKYLIDNKLFFGNYSDNLKISRDIVDITFGITRILRECNIG